ncbi:uncharacterized protein LOC119690276 [Teleopsis dalmanni]|uniref:uncharacterized protein LOC119690276 n=1 Tax=Teleopsis dalmanni TaxID=139649 RepID=UPI0018CDCCE1|nr:uncharacterized protein LOC119690276 [Teleopsis dalmanni]
MNKIVKEFQIGDLVFAKIRGFNAWPARITCKSNKKYTVYFFGTGQIGNVTSKFIFQYEEHKRKYATPKYLKRQSFKKAFDEIEVELQKIKSAAEKASSSVPQKADCKNVQSKPKTNISKPKVSPKHSAPIQKVTNRYNVLLVQGSRDQIISINLDYKKPKSFACVQTRKEWEAASLKEAEHLKFLIEFDLTEVVPVEGKIFFNLPLNQMKEVCIDRFNTQIAQSKKNKSCARNFVTLTMKLHNTLCFDSAHVSDAINYLEQLLKLKYSRVIILGQPLCVDIIRQARRYVGHPIRWKFNDEEIKQFQKMAIIVRRYCEDIYSMFATIFGVPNPLEFWAIYIQQLERFKIATKCIGNCNSENLNDDTYAKLLEILREQDQCGRI